MASKTRVASDVDHLSRLRRRQMISLGLLGATVAAAVMGLNYLNSLPMPKDPKPVVIDEQFHRPAQTASSPRSGATQE